MKRVLFLFFTLIYAAFLISCNDEITPGFTVGNITVDVGSGDISGYDYSGYFPDGKLCFVKNGSNYEMYWAEAGTFKTTAETTDFSTHFALLKAGTSTRVIGYNYWEQSKFPPTDEQAKVNVISGVNENGIWAIGIFPLNSEGVYDGTNTSGKYVGFFHTESHWEDNPNFAHKSICVAYSDDYGETWTDMAPIITATSPKGAAGNTGVGDGCVIRDEKNKRWICYYQGDAPCYFFNNKLLCMAASYDDDASSGTWKKWDGTGFTTTAYDDSKKCGGENISILNLRKVAGANPSVMWNDYLNCYVMVYTSWTHKAYISFSSNGTYWTKPQYLLGDDSNPIWYVNLISDEGDLTGGQSVNMYFSYKQGSVGVYSGQRYIAHVPITFN